jgi:type VI secretion system protein ImpJ
MSSDELRGIQWNQGLFLTPQHFQLLESRPEALLRAHRQIRGPHGWGVARWSLRLGGLENGEIEVTILEAIMPDGTFVRAGQLDQPNARLLQRSRVELPPDHKGPVGLYIALAMAGNGDHARQQAETVNQPNQLVPGESAPVTHLTYRLETLLDVEPLFQTLQRGGSLLRLATLHPLEGRFQLSRDHVPPCLHLAADPLIGDLLRDAAALLHARALNFAELKRDRGIRSGNGTPQDVMRTVILAMLNRQVAQVRALLARGAATHPADAHQALAIIVAELSSFTEEYDLDGALLADTPRQGLPAYDHDDIMGGLRHALDLIRIMAARLSAGPESGITLEYTGAQYEAAIPGHFFDGRQNRYYLLVESDLDESLLASLMRDRAKLGAPGKPEELHASASRGLQLAHLSRPPDDLPQRSARFVYFQIDPREAEWRHVEADGAISLYLPELNPQSSRVKLIKAEAA